MPKKQYIKPEDRMNPNDVIFKDIPAFKYKGTLADELNSGNLTKKDVIEIYKEMKWIRIIETFLEDVKIKGKWRGLEYKYLGPAHISIGQEAAAVGQNFLLTENDFIFGTHRNHAETISKGLSSIYKMSDEKLQKIMEETFDGDILNAIKNSERFKSLKSIKEKATMFFVYALTSEVFSLKNGLNRGLSGSMHMFFIPFGIYPNNAIVGAGLGLALGSALYKMINKKDGIVIANMGDGAVATGPVWETLNMAAMDQYHTLWGKEYQKSPPLMLNVMNNGYGMGGQTVGETMGNKGPARIGAGINPENMHSEIINGQDPLAVIDLMRRKVKILKEGKGPVLSDIITYRFSGHSTGDMETYRTQEEVNEWKEKYDPIDLYKKELLKAKLLSEFEIKQIDEYIEDVVFEIYKITIDEKITPKLEFETNSNVLNDMMLSRDRFEITKDKKCEVRIPKEDNPRLIRIKKRARYAYDESGREISKMRQFQIRDAIFEAILDRFYKEPTLIGYGEELRDWGGAYGVYNGLTESLPYHRLFNSPIAEAAIVGSAVGYAISGGQAIVELEYFDFLFRAGDEIANQLSKWRAMSGGILKIPVVIRTNIGSAYGAQHSQDYTAVITHIPGINVVSPATPYDAKGLMNTALNSNDPTFFIETQKIYDKGEYFVKEGVPEDYYEIPFGEPISRTNGNDLTIITLGEALYVGKEAVKAFSNYNIGVELIDLRSAVPLNYDLLIKSIQKTGKVILLNNGSERSNFMKNVAQNITEMAFDYLDAPPIVLGGKNWIMPGAEFEKYIFPQVEDVLATYHQNISPLKNFVTSKNYTNIEKIKKNLLGV